MLSQEERIKIVNKWARIFDFKDLKYLPESVNYSEKTSKADVHFFDEMPVMRISRDDMPKEEFEQLVIHEIAHFIKSKLNYEALEKFRERLPDIRERIIKYHKQVVEKNEMISSLNYLLLEKEIFARLVNYVTIKGRPSYAKGKGQKPWHLIEVFNEDDTKSVLHLMNKDFQKACKSGKLLEFFNKFSKTDEVCEVLEKTTRKALVPYIALHYGCNLECPYCYAKDLDKEYGKMSLANFKKVIKKLKKDNIKKVCLTGGEPIIHPKFKDFLKVLKEDGIAVRLLTNGLFKFDISKIPNIDIINECSVSCNEKDSYSKSQLKIFERNVRTLSSMKIEDLYLRQNLSSIQQISNSSYILEMCKKYDIKKIILCIVVINTRKNNLYVKEGKLINFVEPLVGYIKTYVKLNIKVILEDPLPRCIFTRKQKSFLKKHAYLFHVCNTTNNFTINPDLSVFPCVALHIKSKPFLSFKNIADLQNYYRKTIAKLMWENNLFEECKDCVYKLRKKCQGTCLTYKL